jgi:DNA-binding XRE family transcriptional regulator
MQTHTRKHPTEKDVVADKKSDVTIDWRLAFTDLIDKFSEAGATLRGLRMREGLTQNELAQKIGITQANISKMEHGKRLIGKAMAKKFASFFHTNYRIFL